MDMHLKMRQIVREIAEGIRGSGGDWTAQELIESAVKKYKLDRDEEQYLRDEFHSHLRRKW